jgi:DNA-binding PadR family transcriptional regulator
MGIFDFLKRYKTTSKVNTITRYDPPPVDVTTAVLDPNELSERDQLVLILISKTSISHPHTLMMRLDRCDFPGKPEKNLSNLLRNRLLYVSEANGFGHPVKYAATELGEEFVKNHIDHDKIIEHIKKMQEPDFMLELVQAIFDRMKTSKDNVVIPTEQDRSDWTGKNFEFLIIGDLEITAENHDEVMTPNSLEWTKIEKDNWPYYQVGQDEFSYSWEPPGIQMTFNDNITFQKAKNIADEIIENIHKTGQLAELVILESGKIYKF